MILLSAADRLGSGFFQHRLLLTAGLAFGSDAGEIMLLSFMTNVLKVTWGLSDAEAATITSSVFAGQIIGTVLVGPLGDRWGRRPTFLITAAIITIFGFLTAAATDYGTLIFFRTMVGVGVGGLTITFDALSEFLPQKSRGKGLIGIEYFWTIGELLVVLFAYLTIGTTGGTDSNEATGWKLLVVLSAIPVLLSLVFGFFTLPESPRWLLSRGRHDEALNVLRQAAKSNGLDPDEAFPEGTKLTEGKEQESNDFRDLLTPIWRKTTLMMWLTWFSVAFTYYGVLQLTTNIFSSTDTTGDITTYTFDYVPILISAFSEFAGTTLIFFAVDWLGRVPSQYISFLTGGITVLALSLLAEYGGSGAAEMVVSFISRMSFMAGFSTTYLHTVEILPTLLRARGHSSSNLFARLGGFASPYLVDDASNVVIGSVLLVVSLLAAFSSWSLPETKGIAMGTAMHDDTVAPSTMSSESSDEVGDDAA